MKARVLPPHSLALLCNKLHGCCQLCGGSVGQWRYAMPLACRLLCDECHQTIVWQPPLMCLEDMVLSVASFYQTPLDRVISAYKDKENLSALMVLYHAICQIPKPALQANAVIVPVPTTKKRLVKRGFNPVLTLAKFLSYWWQVPIWQGVARLDNQTHQRGLDKSQRLSNVISDFYLVDELSVHTRQVILFDDVITTGATLLAVAQTLRAHRPNLKLLAVGVLHGKADFHLPTYSSA